MTSFEGDLNLRFCHEREVVQRRRLFLLYKAIFFYKLMHLEYNGHCQRTLTRLDSFIIDNLDQLYEAFMK